MSDRGSARGGPAFARSAEANLLGKCTAEIPKIRVPEIVLERLSAKATAVGMSLVEYQRWRAMIDALGVDEVSKLQNARLKVIAGKGEE